MCQQIVNFCSNSGKPLMLAGALALLLAAMALGYASCSTKSLVSDIDSQLASGRSLGYYLELACALYMTLVAIFATHAAYYDQKQAIRLLAILTSINFVLAAGAIFMVPAGEPLVGQLAGRLQEAQKSYNFTDKPANRSQSQMDLPANRTEQPAANETQSANEATCLWDKLQQRGCCGLFNGTTEWPAGQFPKSCCATPTDSAKGNFTCQSMDSAHQRPCAELIKATSLQLLLALCLVALANLYLASVSGCSSYRHFHYQEASQSAYS